jgi:hypothetical protein
VAAPTGKPLHTGVRPKSTTTATAKPCVIDSFTMRCK